MRLTKLGHSCVRITSDGGTLVIDPGVWSGQDVMEGADALLITHDHADHLDLDAVRTALERDQGLRLWTTTPVADQLASRALQVEVVSHGDSFAAAGFGVRVHGRDHAVIHPDMPLVPNVGFAIDGTVFHPGDAFTVPQERVPVLLLPVSAPWLKISEVIDYARTVAPERSIAIHDEVLNANGLQLVENLLGAMAGPPGSFSRLPPGTSVDL